MMKKRLISTLLVLCMALALLPGAALAADYPTSGTCGENATWSYDDSTKTLTISGSGEIGFYNGESMTAPFDVWTSAEEIKFDGKFDTITKLGFSRFYNLRRIEIPDGVTKIEYYAFKDCSKLSEVVIPSSVKELPPASSLGIFDGCPMLTTAGPLGSGCSIEFGWTDELPERAFSDCASLKKAILPESMKVIGKYAFEGCSELKDIVLPKSTTHIREYAFSKCQSLESILIPENVITINLNAFDDCTNLKNISVDPKNTPYASQDGMLFNKEKTTLYICPNGANTCTIPESVKRIDQWAFNGCSNLAELVIPDNVIEICPYSNLSQLWVDGCTSLKTLTLTGSMNYWDMKRWDTIHGLSSSGLITAIVKEGTTVLSGTFTDAFKLTTVYLPASLKTIKADTFKNCSSLKNVYFAGTEAQWNALNIESGNQELSLATKIFNTPVPAPSEVPSTPDTPDTPDKPTTPDTPSTPTTPTQLPATVTNGGLGKKVSVQVQSGHWLTIQTRRAGSISISSIQAPVTADGVATVSFSAPSGSVIQVWETAEEMQFSNGIPTTTILRTVVKNL